MTYYVYDIINDISVFSGTLKECKEYMKSTKSILYFEIRKEN